MSGMVKVPIPITFATTLPVNMPMRALPTTAALAEPPRVLPNLLITRSTKYWPAPVALRNEVKRMKITTTVAEAPRGMPKMPSVVRERWLTILSASKPLCASASGMRSPKKAYNRATNAIVGKGQPITLRVPSMTRATRIAPIIMSSSVAAPRRKVMAS